ncbi:unnamed protein product [Callosobruchus maculatus]|uniref:Reverse transcriptase n=1 Tax=Callosobruchus maculatus TaxID=64391 RepID=A0A653CCV3_CALMS|nr:unnamed protein product [Callosobruchus maculatus]
MVDREDFQDATSQGAASQPPASPTSQFTVEDLIQTTVRAMILKDQERARIPSPGFSSPPAPARTPNAEIAALIPEFCGTEDVSQWIKRIDSIRDVYEVPLKTILLLAVSKFTGDAKRWYHSKVDLINMNWDELKVELNRMFYSRTDRISVMRQFEARKWKRGERFTTYFNDKVILGNRLNLPELDLIEYVIDGFNNDVLESQARIKDFTSLNDLVRIMSNISNNDNYNSSKNSSYVKHSPAHRDSHVADIRKCFNCFETGHLADKCPKPKRVKGSCFICGKMDHKAPDCPRKSSRSNVNDSQSSSTPSTSSTISTIDKDNSLIEHSYQFPMTLEFVADENLCSITVNAMLDTGSPISLICEKYLPSCCISPNNLDKQFSGINNSSLNIVGIFKDTVKINESVVPINLYVVSNETMTFPAIIGRDFTSLHDFKITFSDKVLVSKPAATNNDENARFSAFCQQLLAIEYIHSSDVQPNLNVNSNLNIETVTHLEKMVCEEYLNVTKPDEPDVKFEMKICVKNDQPVSCRPRQLSYSLKLELQKIIDKLLKDNIIRESFSPYCSPIVLVSKKNNQGYRLCVDYREINKIIVKDHFPIPLIDDQINLLKNKCIFTKLDLKNGFHQVSMHPDSIQYTSFVTPLGQYEYLKVPFGLCNSPSVFMRFINLIFRNLIKENKIVIYLDDILIASTEFNEHFQILSEVFSLITKNKLELNLQKCSFLQDEIVYLGYLINHYGIRPNPENIDSVMQYPIPNSTKKVQQFIGLASYFRRFIPSFSVIAKPLYDLLKKGKEFEFNESHLNAFNILKTKLCEAPILSIYDPTLETELSSLGFGAILLQRQANKLFQPVFYFSRRTTEVESKYHSYELEMLAIIYAIERFRIYLQGIPFKIVTDCNSVRLALNKRDINRRIN